MVRLRSTAAAAASREPHRPSRIVAKSRSAALRLGSMRARLETTRSRVPLLDLLIDEIEYERELGSGLLAGALAYRLFVFFLPLTVLLVAALGIAVRWFGSSPHEIAKDVGFVGLVTSEVAATAERGSGIWVALGSLLVLGYATSVLYRAVAIVHALAWERSAAAAKVSPRAVRRFALGVAMQLALTIVAGAVRAHTDSWGAPALVLYGAASALVWLRISLGLSHADARWTGLAPGALVYGVGIVGVNLFNLYALGRIHAARATTYGTLGAAAAILFSLFVLGHVIVTAAALNATLFRRLQREAAD